MSLSDGSFYIIVKAVRTVILAQHIRVYFTTQCKCSTKFTRKWSCKHTEVGKAKTCSSRHAINSTLALEVILIRTGFSLNCLLCMYVCCYISGGFWSIKWIFVLYCIVESSMESWCKLKLKLCAWETSFQILKIKQKTPATSILFWSSNAFRVGITWFDFGDHSRIQLTKSTLLWFCFSETMHTPQATLYHITNTTVKLTLH